MLRQYLTEDHEEFDSISQQSYESTVASEFVEKDIERYRKSQNESSTPPTSTNPADKVQVVNIRVDAVNIFGENGGNEGRESFQLTNFSEVITSRVVPSLDSILNQTEKITNEPELKKKFIQQSLLAIGFLLLVGAVVFCVVSLTLKLNADSASVGKAPTDSLAVNIDSFYVNRSQWQADSGRIGSKVVSKNSRAKRVILSSDSKSICELGNCRSVLKKRQSDHSYLFDDIQENFVIGSDGNIYEGRGFERQGQMSFDKFGTTFDKDSLEITFLGTITEQQVNKLKDFLDKCVKEEKLAIAYKIFLNYQIAGTEVDQKLYNRIRVFESFSEVPPIIQNKTRNVPLEEQYELEETIRSIVLFEIQYYRNSISEIDFSNFTLVIADNLVHQIKSFDCLAEESDETRSKLKVSIAVKYYDIKYDEDFINKILNYLVDVGKLKADFKRCFNTKFEEYSEFESLLAFESAIESEDC